MKKFVLDCSVMMSWCFADENTDISAKLLNCLNHTSAIVPNILPLEVQNVLVVAQRNQRISSSNADKFIELISAMPIIIDSGFNNLFNEQILSICRESDLSAYDAAYLELAIRLNLPLATFDVKLSQVAKKFNLPDLALIYS